MITSLKPYYKFTDTVGYTVEEISVPKLNTGVKLHIPKMMPTITRGTPSRNVTMVKTSNLFCNAADCKPTFKRTIHTQNYITVRSDESSTSWGSLVKYLYDEYGNAIATVLPAGTKVYCEFKVDTLKGLVLNTSGTKSSE